MPRATTLPFALLLACGAPEAADEGTSRPDCDAGLEGGLDRVGFGAPLYSIGYGQTVDVMLLRTGTLAEPLVATIRVSSGIPGISYHWEDGSDRREFTLPAGQSAVPWPFEAAGDVHIFEFEILESDTFLGGLATTRVEINAAERLSLSSVYYPARAGEVAQVRVWRGGARLNRLTAALWIAPGIAPRPLVRPTSEVVELVFEPAQETATVELQVREDAGEQVLMLYLEADPDIEIDRAEAAVVIAPAP